MSEEAVRFLTEIKHIVYSCKIITDRDLTEVLVHFFEIFGLYEGLVVIAYTENER